MHVSKLEICKYEAKHRPQIIEVWERSVLATHDFLSQDDFNEIRAFVISIDFNALQVYCLAKAGEVAGFIGVSEGKVEMLFLHPAYFGQGLGTKLLAFAINELKADTVDVNEQNTKALGFYERQGFEVFERTDKDGQGRAYPLLRMRLKQPVTDFK